MAYTIEAAKKSGIFDRLILSTDSREIAKVSKKYGVEVPFLRPEELARDTTPTLPVIVHSVRWLGENEGFFPDYTVILQPTAPLRQPFHIKEAIALLNKSKADSVVSVSEVPGHHNPHWQLVLDSQNRTRIFTGDPLHKITKSRQQLPKTYTRNGAIYAFKTSFLFEKEPSFYGRDVRAYVMDDEYAINIDSLEDFERAKLRIKNLWKM